MESAYGIPKTTDIVAKYNSNVTSVYRDRIQALAEGRPWRDPPIFKETAGSRKPPRGSYSTSPPVVSGGWDSLDNNDAFGSNKRRNQIVRDFWGSSDDGSGYPVRSKSKI